MPRSETSQLATLPAKKRFCVHTVSLKMTSQLASATVSPETGSTLVREQSELCIMETLLPNPHVNVTDNAIAN